MFAQLAIAQHKVLRRFYFLFFSQVLSESKNQRCKFKLLSQGCTNVYKENYWNIKCLYVYAWNGTNRFVKIIVSKGSSNFQWNCQKQQSIKKFNFLSSLVYFVANCTLEFKNLSDHVNDGLRKVHTTFNINPTEHSQKKRNKITLCWKETLQNLIIWVILSNIYKRHICFILIIIWNYSLLVRMITN